MCVRRERGLVSDPALPRCTERALGPGLLPSQGYAPERSKVTPARGRNRRVGGREYTGSVPTNFLFKCPKETKSASVNADVGMGRGGAGMLEMSAFELNGKFRQKPIMFALQNHLFSCSVL